MMPHPYVTPIQSYELSKICVTDLAAKNALQLSFPTTPLSRAQRISQLEKVIFIFLSTTDRKNFKVFFKKLIFSVYYMKNGQHGNSRIK